MRTPLKIFIVLALAVMVAAAVALKERRTPSETPAPDSTTPVAATVADSTTSQAVPGLRRPRMVDLGAKKCIPCKMMAPILADLTRDYSDRFTTEFIDVWENADAGKQYGVEMIPTQIFYDAEGKERFRHVGFLGKDDILRKWEELGVDVSATPSPAAN